MSKIGFPGSSTGGGSNDGSGIGSINASGVKVIGSDITIYGSGSVVVQGDDSTDAIVISGGGGGGSIDLTSVSTNITPDTSGAYEVGNNSLPFASGFFDEIIIRDANGVGWRLTVDTDGILSTTSI